MLFCGCFCVVQAHTSEPVTLSQAHVSFAASHGRASGETVKVDGITYNLFEQHCIQGTAGAQFASDLDTSRFDAVIQKGTDTDEECFSAFCSFGRRQSTGLADWLRHKEVRHVYVAGVALETCVKQTAEDALQLGFYVSLVHDACAPAEANAERDIWQDLQVAGCNMTTVAEVCEASSTQ